MFSVSADRIHSSGMKVKVVATSLKTGQATWWDEKSPDIVQGCVASGSLAPLVYPYEIRGEWYVDGGFVVNTPILAALQEGASIVLVIFLFPPYFTEKIENLSNLSANGKDLGMAIVNFEYGVISYRYFADLEVSNACAMYPDAQILGYIPNDKVGPIIGFSDSNIENVRRAGINATKHPPKDLCKFFNKPRGISVPPNWNGPNVTTLVGSASGVRDGDSDLYAVVSACAVACFLSAWFGAFCNSWYLSRRTHGVRIGSSSLVPFLSSGDHS